MVIMLLVLVTSAGCKKVFVKEKSKLVCGDKICDPDIGETVETCPRDCQPPPLGPNMFEEEVTKEEPDPDEKGILK
jgi:hypothetical protein